MTIEDLTELDRRWSAFETTFKARFGAAPTTDAAFFIIGLEEKFTGNALEKEEKQAVITEGFFKVFSKQGFYTKLGKEWTLEKPMPDMKDAEKDAFFKLAILEYLRL